MTPERTGRSWAIKIAIALVLTAITWVVDKCQLPT